MKYFAHCHTLDELKAEYRRLAIKHHPDHGGDPETMKEINAEHDQRFAVLKTRHNAEADEWHQTTETAEEFREIVIELMRIPGLVVELCGSWLWIGGDTRAHKDELKALGCRWSKSKQLWSWHHAEAGRKWYRGKATMGEIRNKYGSQVFRGSSESTGFQSISGAV